MRDTSLLQLALGIRPPWSVTDSTFDATARRLDIHIDFAAGSRLACPNCGAADCPAHDTEQMTWRHLNFFQHQTYRQMRSPPHISRAIGSVGVGCANRPGRSNCTRLWRTGPSRWSA
jgi:hypothetical protein